MLAAGGYDEALFALAEDYDLALRLRVAGARLLSVEDALVRHRGGTPGMSFRGARYPERRAYLHAKNRWIIVGKSYAARTLLVALPALVVYELVWAVFALGQGHLGATLRGKLDFLREELAPTRAKRARVQAARRVRDRELLVGGPLTFSPQLVAKPFARRLAGALSACFRGWWTVVRWAAGVAGPGESGDTAGMRTLPSLVVLALTGSLSAQAIVESTFDVDVDGWVGINANSITHQATGGNPDGFLEVDNGDSSTTWLFGPEKFRGDKSAYDGGEVRFDGRMISGTGSPETGSQNYGVLTLRASDGTSMEADLAPGQPTGLWTTFAVPLTAATFGVSQGTFDFILADIGNFRLSVEAMTGDEVQALDNVRLIPPIVAACNLRNGNGINPIDYLCVTTPVLGSPWQSSIATPFGTSATIVALAPGGAATGPGNPLGTGELLISLFPAPILNIGVGNHSMPVPLDPSLAGLTLATQGFRLMSTLTVDALNAQDLFLGF